MPARQVALSIDLDALDFYQGLYGLPQKLTEAGASAIPGRATERFGELCARLGMPGTLFVVGRDLALGRGHSELRAASQAGHEIASHSFSHDYGLSRRPVADIELDLIRAEEQIEAVTGKKPVGFRAPGYTLSVPLFDAIRRRGYAYDSSLLPSPPYYAAKALMIGALRLAGRRSHSILGHPGQLFSGRHPYRDESGVLELPVATLPLLRMHFIGTPIVTAPESVIGAMASTLRNDPLVVIELHGVDLIDASDGVPPELLSRSRELKIPAKVKLQRVEAVMRRLLEYREGRTLAGCAAAFSGV